MSTQKAIIIKEAGKAEVVDAPIPDLRDDYVLVKTKAVSLNPTDWKHIAYLASPGALVGCDYAGEVIAVGSAVTKSWKKGDRIAGFTHGGNAVQHADGSFAQQIVAKGDLQMRVPDYLGDAEASTVGVGISTVGQGLYQAMGLAQPDAPIKEKEYVLIYGGSTATGTLGIQFAKLSGYTVLTTCSPRNFDLVKSLGADAVFDYSDPAAVAQIKEFTGDKLRYVWDTISEGSSPNFCAEALAPSAEAAGGELIYGSLLFLDFPRKDVTAKHTLAYTILGEAFDFGTIAKFPAKPEDFEFAKKWWTLAEKLVAERKIKTHPNKLGKGGLEGVLEGLEELKSGKVSGVKLTYLID